MLIVCPACSASYRLAPQALGGGRKVRCARCRTEWYADAPPEAKPPRPSDALPRATDPFGASDDEQRPGPPRPAEPEWGLAADEPSRQAPDGVWPVAAFEDADPVDMTGEAPGGAAEPEPDPAAERRRAAARKSGAARLRGVTPRRALAKVLTQRPAIVVAAVGVTALFVAILMRASLVEAAPSLASLYERVGLPVNVQGLDISDVRSVEDIEEGAPMLVVTGAIANVSRGPRDVPRLRLAVVADDGREVYSWTTVAGRTKIAAGETTQFRARLASPPAEGRRVVVRFLAWQDLATHPH